MSQLITGSNAIAEWLTTHGRDITASGVRSNIAKGRIRVDRPSPRTVTATPEALRDFMQTYPAGRVVPLTQVTVREYHEGDYDATHNGISVSGVQRIGSRKYSVLLADGTGFVCLAHKRLTLVGDDHAG